MKWFPVLNQIIYHFELRIVSDYVLNCSRANSKVRQKASKSIILQLKLDADRDTVTLGSLSNSL